MSDATTRAREVLAREYENEHRPMRAAELRRDGPQDDDDKRAIRAMLAFAAEQTAAKEDHLDEIMGLLTPPGNVWTGSEPDWHSEAYMRVRDLLEVAEQTATMADAPGEGGGDERDAASVRLGDGAEPTPATRTDTHYMDLPQPSDEASAFALTATADTFPIDSYSLALWLDRFAATRTSGGVGREAKSPDAGAIREAYLAGYEQACHNTSLGAEAFFSEWWFAGSPCRLRQADRPGGG